MNFPFFVARRYLISEKSNNAINIISGISALGVCIGTCALVIILSGFNGLSNLVESLYNSFNSDLRITINEGKTFDPSSTEIQQIQKLKGVAFFCETLEENALVKFNNQQCIVTVKGVTDQFKKMSRFDTLIREGQYRLQDGEMIYSVIGKGISYTLNAGTSDFITPLTVFAPKRGKTNSANPEDAFNEKKVYVSGVFSINDDFDFRYMLLPIQQARELLDYTNEVSAIEIGLDETADKEQIKTEIQQILGDKYSVKNRYEQNEILFKTLKSEKLWTFIILAFILVVASFNVIGSLTMLIIEKKRDIGILWRMGAGIDMIRKIFLAEGIMITIWGALCGLATGTIACLIQIIFKPITFGGNYVVDAYPMLMKPLDFLLIIGIVLIIGFLAAWYPVKVFTSRYLKY